MNQLIELFNKGYYDISKRFQRIEIEEFLLLYNYKKIIVEENGKVFGFALYFTLTDKTLSMIKDRKIDITKPEGVNLCFKEKGSNLHIFLVVADGAKTILKGLRGIISSKNFKTISWFSPDMNDFFIRRILCHQLL